MNRTMGDAPPLKATVTRWDPADQVGALELESGETIRFGGSSCRELIPSVGATVFVNGLSAHPLGGRKATAVRGEPVSEVEAERQKQSRLDTERAERLRPLNDAAARLSKMTVLEGFVPAVAAIADMLPKRTRRLLEALAREEDACAALGIEVAQDGNSPPWSFYDPSLWTFAIDGGGNVFALHVYPPAMERAEDVPVVFWDHEEHRHSFEAAGLEQFLSEYIQACAGENPEVRETAEALAARLGIGMHDGGRLARSTMEGRDWLFPVAGNFEPIALTDAQRKERELVRQLIDASFEVESVVEPLMGLDALYTTLGWSHHLSVLQHQKTDWFEAKASFLAGD